MSEMMQKLAENTTPAKGNYKEEYEMQHLPHKLNSEPTEHEMLHLPQEELYGGPQRATPATVRAMMQNKKKYCTSHAKNTWVAQSATPAT